MSDTTPAARRRDLPTALNLLLATSFALAWAIPAMTAELPTVNEHRITTPDAPSAADQLVARHDCWTGQAPADVSVPGHAVVSWPGAAGPTYGGRRAAAFALEHVFGTEHRGMVVYGFCR